jgi:predicted alpha/beta superfamily hydrolase
MGGRTMSAIAAANYFPDVETHIVRSRHVTQTYKIQVARPMQSRGVARRCPVVYATDGNAIFDLFRSLSWLMQAFKPDAIPFTLVTIGYPGESPVTGEVLRGRDLTFAGCPDWLTSLDMKWEGVALAAPDSPAFGGAEAFQSFMAEELFPLIEDRYVTRNDARVYFGHSMGGAFGLFTLFTRPSLFRYYVLSSPAVAYHGTNAAGLCYESDFMLDHARQFIASGAPLDDVHLYMSVGTDEEFEGPIVNWRFTSSFYRLTTLMRAADIPGLRLTTEVMNGEGHTTVWPIAFMHGVQAVLSPREKPR